MATLSTAARNAAANAIADLFDAGTTDASGDIQIGDSGFVTTLATLVMSNPAFGNASTGTVTANAISDDTNTSAGTAAEFRMRDRDNTAIITGTVGTAGADANFNSVDFTAGGIARITALTINVPASP